MKLLFKQEASKKSSQNRRAISNGHRVGEIDHFNAKIGSQKGQRPSQTSSNEPTSRPCRTEQRLPVEVSERQTAEKLSSELDSTHLRGVQRVAQLDQVDRESQRHCGQQGQKDRVKFRESLRVHAEFSSDTPASRSIVVIVFYDGDSERNGLIQLKVLLTRRSRRVCYDLPQIDLVCSRMNMMIRTLLLLLMLFHGEHRIYVFVRLLFVDLMMQHDVSMSLFLT